MTVVPGPIALSIQGAVDAFRSALGANNGDTAGPLPVGRREIDWDGGANDQTTTVAANPFAGFAVSRGVVFSTPNGTGFVQAPPSSDPALFPPGGLAGLFDNPTYETLFRTFSPPRLFSAIESNIVEVDFFVPGAGDTPARTRGFGAVFTNVGEPDGSTLIEYFGADDTVLFSSSVPGSPGDGGLSFFGIVFDDARIAWVRITSGDAPPGPDDGGKHRVVVMDDFIYGEPQPLH